MHYLKYAVMGSHSPQHGNMQPRDAYAGAMVPEASYGVGTLVVMLSAVAPTAKETHLRCQAASTRRSGYLTD